MIKIQTEYWHIHIKGLKTAGDYFYAPIAARPKIGPMLSNYKHIFEGKQWSTAIERVKVKGKDVTLLKVTRTL